MPRPRVLISEPGAAGEQYEFLPYVWAVLKSHWERHGPDRDAYDWLDPIYRRDCVAEELARYTATPPDVLGLSCYTWNWELQQQVARWAKRVNPRCLVVAGGPDPDYKDQSFFAKHPYIDAIVVKDGEIPFTAILETLLGGASELGHVPGLYLPHKYTGTPKVPSVFDYSPYLDQAGYYERVRAARGSGNLNATWETNRGCPFACSFCDWGSATMSKVRRFDMGRVEAEADWLGRMGINFVFLADANFGILPRDVEIADRLAAARAKWGYPKYLYYSSAKNNPDRTVEIARRTHAAGLTAHHILAVQHTDPEVLAATERSNIPAEKYREVVSTLLAAGIPSEVQLILGIPGDTVDRWKTCLAEIMDWGVHDSYCIFPYSLLPNAPAAEAQFRSRWKLETVERWLTSPVVRRNRAAEEGFARSSVVVGCSSYSRQEWAEMSTYSTFVMACHNRALTRLPVMYLRFAHGVPYREAYDAIIDGFCRGIEPVAGLHRRLQAHFERFLVDPASSDEMELGVLPGVPYFVDSSRWLFVNLCLGLDAFYDALTEFLCERFPDAPGLRGAIGYQKSLVVTPDYDVERGRTFTIERDWPRFFDAAHRLTSFRRLDDPPLLQRSLVVEARADDDRGGTWADFRAAQAEERWNRWVDQCVSMANASKWNNLSRIRPVEGPQVAAG
jgi:putative methyltransferase